MYCCWNCDFGDYSNCSKKVPNSSAEFRKSSGEEVILDNSSPAKTKKQSPVRKNHFITYYYKSIDEIVPIVTELKTKAFKGKVQTELTKEGRPHLQGMIWCKTKCRDSCFKLLKGAHFERLKDEDDTANYCNKDESHDGIYRTSWGFPEPPYIEEIDNLYDWEIEIENLLNSIPDKRSIYWYWEPDGCAGKTTYQKYIFTHHPTVVVLSGKGTDMKNGIVQYHEKNNCLPSIVLINMPKSCDGFVSYTGLEEIKDMFFFSGKFKGGMVCGKCPHVLVFANEEPCYNKMTENRFIVKRI